LNDWLYGGSVSGTFSGPDYSSAFHIYAVDWEPGLIIWYIDGVERSRSTFRLPPGRVNPPDYRGDMHIILNLAVGGGYVDQLLPPDASLPAAMQVDYVRVYQKVSQRVFLPYVSRNE
jgi:beta-glucanase (GH16 family)